MDTYFIANIDKIDKEISESLSYIKEGLVKDNTTFTDIQDSILKIRDNVQSLENLNILRNT